MDLRLSNFQAGERGEIARKEAAEGMGGKTPEINL